jgi:hypothetical protein
MPATIISIPEVGTVGQRVSSFAFNAKVAKGTAGTLLPGMLVANHSDGDYFLLIYDKASAPAAFGDATLLAVLAIGDKSEITLPGFKFQNGLVFVASTGPNVLTLPGGGAILPLSCLGVCL